MNELYGANVREKMKQNGIHPLATINKHKDGIGSNHTSQLPTEFISEAN